MPVLLRATNIGRYSPLNTAASMLISGPSAKPSTMAPPR